MALTITPPAEYSAAYNPLIVTAVSDVREDFTTSGSFGIDVITSNGGFAQLTTDAPTGLLQGDFILITSAPGVESIEGVALITSIVDTDNFIINKPFTTGLSVAGTAFKYISNYSMLLKFYIYVSAAPSTAVLVATKLLKPKFNAGFCVFYSDLAALVQSYNYKGLEAGDVLSSDLYEASEAVQVNEKSFVKYGFECFEAFDNPVGGEPVFTQEATA